MSEQPTSVACADDSEAPAVLELRGVSTNNLPRQTILEKEVTPKFFRSWTSVALAGGDYKIFGEVIAWRATLWSGDQMLSEQKSFLW